jgi:hemolysin activation/secretion protein
MYFRSSFRVASFAAALLLAESNSYADVLPGSVMPEQVAKSLAPQPSVVPQGVAPQRVVEHKAQPQAISPEAQKIKFKLNKIILSGNHVFTYSQLERLYKDKIGQTITVAQLFEIVQNITNFYRNNGYIISRAILPPQHVENGIVKVQVIEGYLSGVYVTGFPGGAKCLIEGFGYQIRKCPPLSLVRLEKYMLLVNEIPNTSVRAVLSPSKTESGAADLNMVSMFKPMSAYFSYDNYGTRYIGPQQMTGNVAIYSAINSGDSIQTTYTKTPKGGELSFLDVNYNGPVGDRGSRWILGGTRTHSHPLFVLRPTETDGLSTNYYTGFTYPYIRNRSTSLNLTAGFNYLDSNTTIFPNVVLYSDHIRSIDLGMNLNYADSYYGANLILLNFRKGLPFLGYSSDTNVLTAQTSRPGGYAAYQKVGAQYSRLQAIYGSISMLGVARGQWAFVPLLSSEQFTFGGNPIGRGYDPAELIGDRGVAASLELRYDKSIYKFINTLQLYGFYDIGAIWNLLVNPTSPTKVSASSAGLGLRFTMNKYVSGNLMWAQPLTKQVAAEELIQQGWRPRTFFSVVANVD